MLRNLEQFNTLPHPSNTDETYNIVLNSNLAGGTVNDATFNFDWSVLPDRNYIVHFSYNTANMALATGKVCLISSDDLKVAGGVFQGDPLRITIRTMRGGSWKVSGTAGELSTTRSKTKPWERFQAYL
jgi:hypothetical protein